MNKVSKVPAVLLISNLLKSCRGELFQDQQMPPCCPPRSQDPWEAVKMRNLEKQIKPVARPHAHVFHLRSAFLLQES